MSDNDIRAVNLNGLDFRKATPEQKVEMVRRMHGEGSAQHRKAIERFQIKPIKQELKRLERQAARRAAQAQRDVPQQEREGRA